MLRLNVDGVEGAGWNIDIFGADNLIMLAHLRAAELGRKIPSHTGLELRGDNRLGRVDRAQLAILVNSCRTKNPVLVHDHQIGIGD